MKDPERIAVFRMGHLGDMVVAMPALWTVRRRFPDARIVFLNQEHEKGKLAQGMSVLRPGTVYDDTISYHLGEGGVSKVDILRTLVRLRLQRIDLLVYIPAERSPAQLRRDRLFFRLAGVKRIVGMTGFEETDPYPQGKPLPTVEHTADLLLGHLRRDGIEPDVPSAELAHLGLSEEERAFAREWLARQNLDLERPLVGLGPGGKQTSNHWPIERYREVALALQSDLPGLGFVLFGGPAEREACASLAKGLERVAHGEGDLSIRQAAAVLEHCTLFVGNNTGITHVAASAGVRCVTVHSARDWPGRWYPYGKGHRVFRRVVPCEGCLLETCDRGKVCILDVEPPEVLAAARLVLAEASTPA